jgi:hypothetical protein
MRRCVGPLVDIWWTRLSKPAFERSSTHDVESFEHPGGTTYVTFASALFGTLMERPTASIAGLGLVALGLPFYFLATRRTAAP